MNVITIDVSDLSKVFDGYHTIQELYDHRHALFIALLHCYKHKAFKTKKDDGGSEIKGWFIAGINSSEGQITYHLPEKYWHQLNFIKTIESNADYDGHSSEGSRLRLLELRPEGER